MTANQRYPAIIPILVYEDIEAGHDHLVETFGFTSGGLQRGGDGTIVHGEVEMDDAAVWQDYGLRAYGARDLENHRWWFSSHLGWRRASFR